MSNSTSNIPTGSNPYSYPTLEANSYEEENQSLEIRAAFRYLANGHWETAQRILTKIDTLNPALLAKKELLLAKIDLMHSQPQAALSKLSTIQEVNNLPPYFQIQYHETLASAYQWIKNAPESINERIKLDSLLTDEKERNINLRALWQTLITLPLAELNTLVIESSNDKTLNGWFTLAQIYRRFPTQHSARLNEIEKWKQSYPYHVAGNLLLIAGKEKVSTPQHIALLLPLTGPLAGPGNAIREGFMAAYKARGKAKKITVNLYDTYLESPVTSYNKAVAAGADYIVGPLAKNDVAKVAMLEHPVPTLLLNDLNIPFKENLYQFSLSPRSESKQVADKMGAQRLNRVLLIAPAGVWGEEITLTFANELQLQGGKIVDRLYFNSNEDLNKAIRQFLRVDSSEVRGKQLKAILGDKIQTLPNRRQDFDAIFLVAYSSKARQIVPLLRYYYLGNRPIYATSTVYAGNQNTMRDRDLDGILFCDMPWIFKHSTIYKNWPEQFNSYNRLYALGRDSYTLATEWNELNPSALAYVEQKKGSLSIDSNQRVVRNLVWGEFKQGVTQLIG